MKELGILIQAIKRELDWWYEELANCNGADAADTARTRITALTWALNDVGVFYP